MYEAYFGLRERPFSIAPDPSYLYLSSRHREALAHLLYGITERGGFVQLTGEVGTGKTTITRALLDQLPGDVDVALILNPNVTVREFLVAICAELKIEEPKRGHSTQALMEAITHYLLDAYARGRHTVVLVDEAQNLSGLVLEQVRLLTNLETTKEKLLQIILVGQPELRAMLRKPELRQVSQRITARYHLAPLSLRETHQYVQHRLAIAGTERPLFSRLAVRAIHRLSGGIPRLINVICDRALLGAYAARATQVSLPMALKAAREVQGREGRRWGRWALGGALAAALLAAGLGWRHLPQQPPAAPAPAPVAAVAAPQPPPGLEERLRTRGSNANAAFRGLFQLWSLDLRQASGQTPCEQARGRGLRCYHEHGSWEALVQRNLPAIIELRDGGGQRHQVLLRQVKGREGVIELQGETHTVPIAEITALWTRESVALWRPPAALDGTLGPGSAQEGLRWVVARLDRVENRSTPTVATVFDKRLEARVKDFQRSRDLAVDGLVGEMTLLHLFTAAPDPGAPTLAGN